MTLGEPDPDLVASAVTDPVAGWVGDYSRPTVEYVRSVWF